MISKPGPLTQKPSVSLREFEKLLKRAAELTKPNPLGLVKAAPQRPKRPAA